MVEIVQVATVMTLGSFIQSSAGFGFGLFAIPLFLLLGFNLPEAVMMVVVGSAVQKIAAVGVLWRAVAWRELLPYMAVGQLALPLGVYLMYRVSVMSPATVKQVIGSLVLVMLLLQWKGIVKVKERVHRIWGYLAGFFSGLLNGLANIGGPPLVLWILVHPWSNEKMRVTAIAFSLVFVPSQVVLMFVIFGPSIWPPMLNAFLQVPALLLGTWLGLMVGGRISRRHLRIYMQVLLLFIALSAVLGPLLP